MLLVKQSLYVSRFIVGFIYQGLCMSIEGECWASIAITYSVFVITGYNCVDCMVHALCTHAHLYTSFLSNKSCERESQWSYIYSIIMPVIPNEDPPAAATTSTGYGPSTYRSSSSRRLEFDGDGLRFELFESKLLGHMRRLRMHKTILPESEGLQGC